MNRYARKLTCLSALLLGVGLLTTAARAYDAAEDMAIKGAQTAIVDLAKDLQEGKAAGGKPAAIRAKYEDLGPLMHVYKPRMKKGLGVGKKGPGDGIENKLISLSKRAPSAAALKGDKAALLKMAYANLAVADVTDLYAPAKPKAGKGAKEWKTYTADMKKGTLELIKALNAGEPAMVKAAALNITNACNNCHTDFRD